MKQPKKSNSAKRTDTTDLIKTATSISDRRSSDSAAQSAPSESRDSRKRSRSLEGTPCAIEVALVEEHGPLTQLNDAESQPSVTAVGVTEYNSEDKRGEHLELPHPGMMGTYVELIQRGIPRVDRPLAAVVIRRARMAIDASKQS